MFSETVNSLHTINDLFGLTRELRNSVISLQEAHAHYADSDDERHKLAIVLTQDVRRAATLLAQTYDQLLSSSKEHLQESEERHRLATAASEKQLENSETRNRLATVASEEHFLQSEERHRLATVASEKQLENSETRNRLATVASEEHFLQSEERHRLATVASEEQLENSEERNRLATVTNEEQLQKSERRNRLATVASEDRLQESEDRYRLATEAAEMGTWYWDLRTGNLIWDKMCRSLYGLSEDAIVTHNVFLELLHSQDRQQTELSINRTLIEGVRYDVEYRVVWPDQTVHWIAAKGRPDRLGRGKVYRMQGVAVDVTARRTAAEALLEGEAKLNVYLESASQGIVAVGSSGQIKLINRRAEEMFGYPPCDLLGQPVEVLLPERYRAEYLQNRAGFFAAPLVRPKGMRRDFAGLRKDGSEISVEIGLSYVPGNQGGTAIAFITDISDRKLAEEVLRSTLSELQTLVETCPLAILTIDTDGVVTGWNKSAERTFGFRRDEVLHRFPPFVPQEGRNDFMAIVKAIRNDEPVVHRQSVFQTKVGSAVDVEIWATALRGTDGTILHGVVVMADVTDTKVMAHQLLQAQKMDAVGQLAGGVAHDFNNLLTVISGYNEMLIQRLQNQPQLLAYAEEVHRGAARASGLTNQLLAFSRRQVIQPQVLDLNEVVVKIESMLRRVIGEEIQIIMQLAPKPAYVKVDPTQIDQIIVNLVVNARDAMPEGGTITLETTHVELNSNSGETKNSLPSGSYVMLTVTDTGFGMDAETKKHLFEPFFTTKDKDKGTGLGLSIVYGIMKQHGGDVQITSELGQGATFRVYIPAAASAVKPSVPVGPTLARSGGTERVLLVEDEVVVRNLVSEMLRDHGFEVIEATTPHVAIQLATNDTTNIHLLLTDVIMPRMRGPELARSILQLHPETAVVFMSGYSHSDSGDVLPENALYVQKPFSAMSLITVLRQALERQLTKQH